VNILSCVQFRPRLASCPADVSDNIRRSADLVHETARLGSQLIVFPELAFTGYSFLGRDEAARVSEAFDGPTFRAMRGVAVELKAYVAWGYVEVADGKLHNSCSMVGPDGALVSSYRKINLYSCDYLWATPGEESAPIVDTELGRTSVVICRDIRDKIPENIPRVAKEKSLWRGKRVEIVAGMTNWGSGGGYPPVTFMNFAADNHCTLAVADRWGDENVPGTEFVSKFGTGKTAIITSKWDVHTGGMVHGADCVVSAAF
jgi:predicted amidohydrolase